MLTFLLGALTGGLAVTWYREFAHVSARLPHLRDEAADNKDPIRQNERDSANEPIGDF
jgi:hypothetical protein